MAISKELEARGLKKPILLKGTGQSLCLEVKIGSLGLELWHFPNEEAQPYARLLFEPVQDEKADDLPEWERTELSVILDWQQACTVSEGIQEWLSFLESDIDDDHGPALHMELGSLRFNFYRQGVGQGPRIVCTVYTECGSSRQVILTRSEQASLAGCFFWQGDEEADQQG